MSEKLNIDEAALQSIASIFLDPALLEYLPAEQRMQLSASPAWAMFTILDHVHGSEQLIDSIASLYLARYYKSKEVYGYMFCNYDHLRNAAKTVRYGASRKVTERVMTAAAQAGWYSEVAEITDKGLKRHMTSGEVHALIDGYINVNKEHARSHITTERELMCIVYKHFSTFDALHIKKRLRDFNKKYNESRYDGY